MIKYIIFRAKRTVVLIYNEIIHLFFVLICLYSLYGIEHFC